MNLHSWNRRRLSLLALLALAAAALTLSGCSAGKTTTAQTVIDEQSTDPDVVKAVALYKNQCLVCHGPQLEKRMGTSRSVLTGIGGRLSEAEIRDKILKGGNGMIAYKGRLTDEEVNTLSKWLSSKK